MKSEMFISKDSGELFVVFGGKIHIAIGGNTKHKTASVMLQELDKQYDLGSKHEEVWDVNKPTVHLVFNDVRSIGLFREALDEVEKYLKNNQ